MAYEYNTSGPQSNEELLRLFRNKMYKDRTNLSANAYPIYPGETISPMSVSTQNARKLNSLWENKPLPYSNKINQVVSRENKGFSDPQLQDLMRMVRRYGVSEDLASRRLNKQFGRNFGYENQRDYKLKEKIDRDINRTLPNSENNLKDLSNQLEILEGKRNTQIGKSFSKAGEIKKGRREAHINQLEEFGNQEHAFRNLKNKAKQNAFNEEVNAPYDKIRKTEEALRGINFDEMHPDRLGVENQQLQKIINSYNQPYAKYPGERVVDIDPESKMGWELTNQISPKYRDQHYNERKALEKGWTEGDNLATQTFNKTKQGINPLMTNLDYLTKQQLKKESKNIGGKHVKLGTYGSEAHKGETEKALRDILKLVQNEREGIVLGTAKNNATIAGGHEENALQKYNQMGGLGGQEFMNLLSGHKNLVKEGNKKWSNTQEDENERTRAWYNQLNYENPLFNTPPEQKVESIPTTNLNALFSQTAPFSETVKTPMPLNQPVINNLQENHRQQQLKNQQIEQQRIEQQRLNHQKQEQHRLELQRQEQLRTQQLEQQRQQQLKNQQLEQQRLEQQKRLENPNHLTQNQLRVKMLELLDPRTNRNTGSNYYEKFNFPPSHISLYTSILNHNLRDKGYTWEGGLPW